MHHTDQQSGSVNKHSTQTEQLNGGSQMTDSNKMCKATSKMDQQTLTEHWIFQGGCGYVAKHPLITQENKIENERPETQTIPMGRGAPISY